MEDNMLEEKRCACGSFFWDYDHYIDCIWCWYDRIFKRKLA